MGLEHLLPLFYEGEGKEMHYASSLKGLKEMCI